MMGKCGEGKLHITLFLNCYQLLSQHRPVLLQALPTFQPANNDQGYDIYSPKKNQ